MNYFSISPQDLTRFFSKVDLSFGMGLDACWQWENRLDNGYGRFWLHNRTQLAHRISYLYFNGEIPSDKQLDHLCRNRSCVNPKHLEAVDIKTNVLRGIGPSAENARKTHCKRNHALSGENLYVNNRNQRVCKECHKSIVARWAAKNGK
jgi:hypothetical protein